MALPLLGGQPGRITALGGVAAVDPARSRYCVPPPPVVVPPRAVEPGLLVPCGAVPVDSVRPRREMFSVTGVDRCGLNPLFTTSASVPAPLSLRNSSMAARLTLVGASSAVPKYTTAG